MSGTDVEKKGPPTENNDELIAVLKTSETPVPWWCSANAPEMLEHKLKIKNLHKEFNKDEVPEGGTLESVKPARIAILKRILGKMGTGADFEVPFSCLFGCNIRVGDNVFANQGLSIQDCAPVTIGSRVLIGPYVTIHTASHSTSVSARQSGLLFARPVTIGDDCWICGNVVIVPGVTIGNGCTITAGSVVTHDIPPFSIARGNPAEVIGEVEDPGASLEFAEMQEGDGC